MPNFREIVTKAVIGKGKKVFSSTYEVTPVNKPSTILGCWVINHNFNGRREADSIIIDGSYDVNIWYSYDNDTKTDVYKETNNYQEVVNVRKREEADSGNEEIIVRSLKQPSCTKVNIENGNIIYSIDKELGIELVGDTKVKIAVDENEDPWDEIEEAVKNEDISNIDNEVNEEYLEDVDKTLE